MKLTKFQFCEAVRTYEQMCKEESEICNCLDVSPEWKPSEWISSYYDLLTEVCELESNPLVGTDLDWFCCDANFGHNVFNMITDNSGEWVIDSPEKLYDYITKGESK